MDGVMKVGRCYSILSALMSTTLVNFINGQNPDHPSSSTAANPLLSITRPERTLDGKVFSFSGGVYHRD